MNEIVTISEMWENGEHVGWYVQCSHHPWFNEKSYTSFKEFAETYAERHLKTYHN